MSEGKKLTIDPNAQSADADKPAFLSRPQDSPVYHGFIIIPETRTDGWCFGSITEFEDPNGCSDGDGFVVAPDGTRAGIIWEVNQFSPKEILPPSPDRWGVYAVGFPKPVCNIEDMVECFRSVLPNLKEIHAGIFDKA